MGCADADTLAALVGGALSDSERLAIANHAATCEACHALIEGLVDDTPPETIGRYVIGERLGAGGMGIVYAATDSELHRRVAVKLLHPEGRGALGTQGRERLMREARTLARLSHANVVTVFDVGTHEGGVFLAMELVEGGSFASWLHRKPRTIDEIVDRAIEIGQGLAAAHDAGVVHRDVKPDNVLVGRDGRARVTDFGLARLEATIEPLPSEHLSPAAADLTRTGAVMGTPIYMAPEQMLRGKTDVRTDQWSFCAMLYEAIAGVRPFAQTDLAARAAAIEKRQLAPGRKVPSWIQRIIMRGLDPDPSARWPSMHAVIAELERGRTRPRRIARWLAAVGVLALAGVAAFAITRKPTVKTKDPRLWTDTRPGCNCPYSACVDGKCLSHCNATTYPHGAAVAGVSIPGRQEVLLSATPDGDAILFLAGEGCETDRLFLARRYGQRYESVDITDKVDRTRFHLHQDCCALSPDARSIVVPTLDNHGFGRISLVENTVDTTELTNLLDGPTIQIRRPVFFADELTLYYKVYDRGPDGDIGPLEGTYAATRADRNARFGPGVRLPGYPRTYAHVTGITDDHLTLFMDYEFTSRVLVRASTSEPFGGPFEAQFPTIMYGWRTIPVHGCQRLLTTWTPGGCRQEDIVWLEPAK